MEITCKFCKAPFQAVAAYCDHLKLHKSVKNNLIPCPWCKVQVSSQQTLHRHLASFHHQQKPSLPESCANTCPVEECTVKLTSRKHYLAHMKDHFPEDLTFVPSVPIFFCIYPNCKNGFKKLNQFRTHMSRYHGNEEIPLQPIELQEEQLPYTADMEIDTDFQDIDILNTNSFEDSDKYPYNVVKDEMAIFYLKLEAECLLPTTTVQTIAEEIKLMTEMSHYHLQKSLREELENLGGLDKATIGQILKRAFKNDPVFNVHHKNEDEEQLGTEHLRSKFWTKRFPFIEPREIFLGFDDSGKKRRAHLIPMRKSIEIMLQDAEVKEAVLQSFKRTRNSDILQDFTDGSAFEAHCKQHEGQKCIQIILFQDACDFNAFGSTSCNYKPNGFYFILGNLPPEWRSNLDLIQLAYQLLEKDMKGSQEEELKDIDKLLKALEPLIEELKDLKLNGIEIDGEKIQVCLLFLVGDSLGQHTVGGFVKSFTAEFSCRFCPITKSEFKDQPWVTKPFRKPEEYDDYVKIAKNKWFQNRRTGLNAMKRARQKAKRQADKVASKCSAPAKKTAFKEIISKSAYKKLTAVNFKGVKYRSSPFNSEELNFHVCKGPAQVPCLAHDLFEGIVKTVLAKILEYFIETKDWFDLNCLNRRIRSFKCKGADSRDAPTPLKSLDKLSGSAVENWNMLRLLPFLIGDLILDEEDAMWKIFLSLKEICEYVCAPKISLTQVAHLKSLINLYLANVKEYLPSCLTPKHHFLAHYPDLTVMYGPLIRLFTLRFESKHMFFKRVAKACQNYINITKTLSRKYVARFAYDHISGIAPLKYFYNLSSAVNLDVTILKEDMKAAVPSNFINNGVQVLQTASVNSVDYKIDHYFILSSDGTSLIVGCIKMILLQTCTNKISFMLEKTKAINSFNGYYKIIEDGHPLFQVVPLEEVPDYFPLPSYYFGGSKCLTLKHTIVTMT